MDNPTNEVFGLVVALRPQTPKGAAGHIILTPANEGRKHGKVNHDDRKVIATNQFSRYDHQAKRQVVQIDYTRWAPMLLW
jgi:hypothetical protein